MYAAHRSNSLRSIERDHPTRNLLSQLAAESPTSCRLPTVVTSRTPLAPTRSAAPPDRVPGAAGGGRDLRGAMSSSLTERQGVQSVRATIVNELGWYPREP